jgi:hypothetical protein
MDDLKYKTDQICADAALLFRKLDSLDRERRHIAGRLRQDMMRYRLTMRVYGFGMDHFRKAIEARGML